MADQREDEMARARAAAREMVQATAGLSLPETLYAVTLATASILRTTMPDLETAKQVVEAMGKDTETELAPMFGVQNPKYV
jgi:hypothetical protein